MEAVVVRSAWRTAVSDYFEMTKPRVQSLLLFTTVTTMYVAGDPSLGLVALTCLGGALSAGGAGAINHVLDRDIDRAMRRTANRPVASGRVSPAAGMAFGVVLGAAAFLLLATTVNLLAATLSLSGLLGYVFVYTLWLKRSTPQNIVIGGAAGAVPPLVAWAAVTGGLTGTPLYLFAIVFFWTPPHFWALSLLMKDDYARAGVPMLPVVRGERETRRQILLYTVLLYAVSQLPFCAGAFGLTYLVASVLLGAAFIYGSWRLMRQALTGTAASLPTCSRSRAGSPPRSCSPRSSRASSSIRPWRAAAWAARCSACSGSRFSRWCCSPCAAQTPSRGSECCWAHRPRSCC
jgi:protoheme IX farnesyltransferase